MPAVARGSAVKAPSSKAASTANPMATNPKRTAHMNAPSSDNYTASDVARHSTKEDAWVIIDDSVYDITHWIPRHPGGSIPLVQYA
jgi:delta8-fatty-acid desaturase